MNLRSDLYQSRSKIDFLPIWARSVPISAGLAALALLLLLFLGLNKSIDFEGGGIFEVPVSDGVSVADARSAISTPEARVQIVKSSDGQSSVRVQTGSDTLDDSSKLVAELAELGGVSEDAVGINTVGPTWGDQITAKAVRALVIFFIVVAVYLAWRLEWRMAIGALIAVVHDLLITAGFYSLFRLEVSPATVIALLTIMGYSLYDTVVVYDKVLENEMERGSRNKGYTALVNRSMNQVLMRSINTTITHRVAGVLHVVDWRGTARWSHPARVLRCLVHRAPPWHLFVPVPRCADSGLAQGAGARGHCRGQLARETSQS